MGCGSTETKDVQRMPQVDDIVAGNPPVQQQAQYPQSQAYGGQPQNQQIYNQPQGPNYGGPSQQNQGYGPSSSPQPNNQPYQNYNEVNPNPGSQGYGSQGMNNYQEPKGYGPHGGKHGHHGHPHGPPPGPHFGGQTFGPHDGSMLPPQDPHFAGSYNPGYY